MLKERKKNHSVYITFLLFWNNKKSAQQKIDCCQFDVPRVGEGEDDVNYFLDFLYLYFHISV
jgi:hypothetical protein